MTPALTRLIEIRSLYASMGVISDDQASWLFAMAERGVGEGVRPDLAEVHEHEEAQRTREATGHEPWRVGSHYAVHVYQGERPVATFHDPADAARAVAAANSGADR